MQAHLWTSFDQKTREKLALEAKKRASPFDLVVINAEEDGGIDQVRELQQFLSRKPTQGEKNLGLILEAHLLSLEACHALLKTLEEPPAFSELILISKSVDHLLPTIISRCELREENGESSEKEEVDWNFLIQILEGRDSLRLNLAEKLELDSWTQTWQHLMQQKIFQRQTPGVLNSLSLAQIESYLKTLLKGAKMQEAHVNAKLLAYNLVLLAPSLAKKRV